jgi:hypothetical protein
MITLLDVCLGKKAVGGDCSLVKLEGKGDGVRLDEVVAFWRRVLKQRHASSSMPV